MCASCCLLIKQHLLPVFRTLHIAFFFSGPFPPSLLFLPLLFFYLLPLFHQVSCTLISLIFHGNICFLNANAHIFKGLPCWKKASEMPIKTQTSVYEKICIPQHVYLTKLLRLDYLKDPSKLTSKWKKKTRKIFKWTYHKEGMQMFNKHLKM